MAIHAYFSFGYTNKDNMRVEWWNVIIDNKHNPVKLILVSDWVRNEASINDIRQMAINEAKKTIDK